MGYYIFQQNTRKSLSAYFHKHNQTYIQVNCQINKNLNHINKEILIMWYIDYNLNI